MMLHTDKPELMEQIDWLIPSLPPVLPIEVRGEADYYGATAQIARAVGLGILWQALALGRKETARTASAAERRRRHPR